MSETKIEIFVAEKGKSLKHGTVMRFSKQANNGMAGWLVVLGFNATLTVKVIS